jgi:gamma-butyrobetaine dioxygenase
MFGNHRLLHGRTTYDVNQGDGFPQGCYIDYDSIESKLRYLKKKFSF